MKEKTDIYDKYGQEISNGDIIDYNGKIGIVYFERGRYQIVFVYSDGEHYEIKQLDLYKIKSNNLKIAPKSVDCINKFKKS